MIDKTVFIKTILERAKSLPVGDYLDIRSYKRNRSLLFIRVTEDHYHIIEDGFFQEEFHLKYEELRSFFKKVLKREFPRSHKLRVYNMGAYDAEKHAGIKRKKI